MTISYVLAVITVKEQEKMQVFDLVTDVIHCYWFLDLHYFYFHLFLAMVMYDNEVWNKGKWNLNLAMLIICE